MLSVSMACCCNLDIASAVLLWMAVAPLIADGDGSDASIILWERLEAAALRVGAMTDGVTACGGGGSGGGEEEAVAVLVELNDDDVGMMLDHHVLLFNRLALFLNTPAACWSSSRRCALYLYKYTCMYVCMYTWYLLLSQWIPASRNFAAPCPR